MPRPTKKTKPPQPPSKHRRAPVGRGTAKSTIIWGAEAEKDDFIKVPRALLRLGRYDPDLMAKLQPRHLLLLLALAARKFRDGEIRVYWEALAEDMGVRPDTVRKWGYELRKLGLLRILQHRRQDPERRRPGIRNDRNGFDLSPFVSALQSAVTVRRKDRQKRHRHNGTGGGK